MSILKKSKFLFRPWREVPLWDATANNIIQWFEMFEGGKYEKHVNLFKDMTGEKLFGYSKENFKENFQNPFFGTSLYHDLHFVRKTNLFLYFNLSQMIFFLFFRVLDVIWNWMQKICRRKWKNGSSLNGTNFLNKTQQYVTTGLNGKK